MLLRPFKDKMLGSCFIGYGEVQAEPLQRTRPATARYASCPTGCAVVLDDSLSVTRSLGQSDRARNDRS